MLGFHRSADSNDYSKPVLKPAHPESPTSPVKTIPGLPPRIPPAGAAPVRDAHVATPPLTREAALGAAAPAPSPAQAAVSVAAARDTADGQGSRLFIGVNIKLKGVEISDCDVLVIEGHMDATVHSKVMQIDKPGTLKGTALIDVAEIHGEFAGELTARTRLVVHSTGRVSGTIRYGKLIVAEGGELTGDVKSLELADASPQLPHIPPADPRAQPETARPTWPR